MKRNLYLTLIAILVLALCVTAFAACKNKNKEPEHLKPVDGSTIAYDGDVVTWGAVENAEGYWVYLNDSTEYYATQDASMSLRLSEDVTFSVLAVANNADYVSAETKGSATFTYLPMVESIGVKKRTVDKVAGVGLTAESLDYFTWNAVEGADSYVLRENGSIVNQSYQPENNSGVLTQPIGANFDSKGGQASLAILPKSEKANTYSHWSDVKTVTVLADPDNFGYNKENNLISWKSVANALVYEVKVGQDIDAVEEWRAVTNNFYVYGENVDNFKMGVKAVGNYENDVLDSRVVRKSFEQMPALEGIAVNFGELVWNPVATATEYQVRIGVKSVKNGKTTTENLVDTVVRGTSYTGAFEALLDENTYGVGNEISYTPSVYTAYVRPVISSSDAGETVSFANWTVAEFSLLQTPELIYSGNETFTWNAVPGAASYYVWLYRNGVNEKSQKVTDENDLKFYYNFSKNSGTYELRIAALSDKDNGANSNVNGQNGSRKSDAFTVLVISAPTEYTMMSAEYDAATAASQTEDNQAPLNFFFNDVYGANYYVASRYYDYVASDADGDGVVDVEGDSSSANTKLEFDTIDAVDTVGENAAYGKHNVTVNTVIAGAEGRTDTIYLYAKSSLASTGRIVYVEKYALSDNTYAFREALDENNNPVKTNMIILNGDDSTPIQVTQLPTPQKVKLTNGAVTWDKVSQASGYELMITRKDVADAASTVVTAYSNHYYLDLSYAGEYEITVRARGNGNILISSVFGSPLSVIKLPAVEDVKVENQSGATVLSWSPSSIRYADQDFSSVSYEVRVGNYLFNADENNFLTLENRKQFFTSEGSACTVTAIAGEYKLGDNAYVVDSNKSETITVFKLTVPQNLTMQNGILAWSYDGNARGFKIYDGDTEIGRTTATQLAINEENGFTKDIYNGHPFNFSVVAVMDITNGAEGVNPYYKESNAFYVDSEDSVQLNLTMLKIPEVNVAQDTGAASWKKVVGASSYLVKVKETTTGEEMNYNVTDYSTADYVSFVPTVLTGDKSTVRISVTAIGNNIDYFNSFSFYYETKVEKLAELNKKGGETFSMSVNYDVKTGVATSITVHVYDVDDQATKTKGRGYIVNVGGLEHFTADGDYTIENLYAGNYSVMVCAAGNNYEGEVTDEFENNVLYINSDYSEVKDIYVLGAPSARDISVSYGGLGDLSKRLVYFAAVPNACGYKLSYQYQKLEDSGEYSDIKDANGVIEFNVGSNKSNAYIDKQYETDAIGRVCFVLDDVNDEVALVVLTVQVLGDGVNSVSNEQTTASYNVSAR